MRTAWFAAVALIATPALAQSGAASPAPARESSYGMTTGSPMSSRSQAPTSGSAMSTARLPQPGARRQGAKSGRTVGTTYGGVGGFTDRAAPMNATGPH